MVFSTWENHFFGYAANLSCRNSTSIMSVSHSFQIHHTRHLCEAGVINYQNRLACFPAQDSHRLKHYECYCNDYKYNRI